MSGAVPLLRAENLHKHFQLGGPMPLLTSKAWVRAVDGISFQLEPCETLSLVGESGCGKTTTARLILLLDEPTAGRVLFRGTDLRTLSDRALHDYRARVQAVFQHPWSSLNPRQRVGDIVGEPLLVMKRVRGRELRDRVRELLCAVGLDPALAGNFPHELSGGMGQRVAVARALALQPSLVVLDEPVSALDVSVRAQIINLLKDLQDRFGVAYLLIAHNLGTVRYLSHRVAVMYLGKIVETAPSEALFKNPRHPYTKALISAAIPTRPGETREEIVLSGEVPSATAPPPGCRFHTRCPLAFARCSVDAPRLQEVDARHEAACHLY